MEWDLGVAKIFRIAITNACIKVSLASVSSLSECKTHAIESSKSIITKLIVFQKAMLDAGPEWNSNKKVVDLSKKDIRHSVSCFFMPRTKKDREAYCFFPLLLSVCLPILILAINFEL